ncbi:hypothetical protein [Streptomyces chryseus]
MARTQSRCGAQTTKGTGCRRLAMVDASRCDLHRGDWSSSTVQRRKDAEREAKARRGRE